MVFVGSSLLMYLKCCIIGCSLRMMSMTVWWCLRSFCIVSPRRGAFVFCFRGCGLNLRVSSIGERG